MPLTGLGRRSEVGDVHGSATTDARADLSLTGERTLPGIPHENYWFRRHEVAYLAIAPWVRGAIVLEAGCGEGYGAGLLATYAKRVIAFDYDAPTLAHVRRRYGEHTVAMRGDLQRLPLHSGSVEAVVCMQVIEHLHDQPGFLRECARVLRPAGTLIVSTPNRLTFSPGRDTPLNPFHTRELSAAELAELLAPCFDVARMFGVRHGWRLRRTETRFGGDIMTAQLACAPAGWSPSLARAVASVRAADFDVVADGVDASLDLLAVAVRRP